MNLPEGEIRTPETYLVEADPSVLEFLNLKTRFQDGRLMADTRDGPISAEVYTIPPEDSSFPRRFSGLKTMTKALRGSLPPQFHPLSSNGTIQLENGTAYGIGITLHQPQKREIGVTLRIDGKPLLRRTNENGDFFEMLKTSFTALPDSTARMFISQEVIGTPDGQCSAESFRFDQTKESRTLEIIVFAIERGVSTQSQRPVTVFRMMFPHAQYSLRLPARASGISPLLS